MRILNISDVYFPRINGVSTSIQTFSEAFRQMGHEVTLIAPDYYRSNDGIAEDIIRIPSRYLVLDPEDRMMKASKVTGLIGKLKNKNFDILHIHTPFIAYWAGMKLSKRLNLPRVISYHTYFEEYLYNYLSVIPRSLLRLAARKFSRSQCNQCHAIVVPSSSISELLKVYGVNTRSTIIPTGIDLDTLPEGDGARFRRQHNIDCGVPTLVYVGRIASEKNIDLLLEVAARVVKILPNLVFVIAGEGPALGELKIKTAGIGLQHNVKFVGYLSRERDLFDCYAAGDAFVFASKTETQGLVLLEAMATGVPVVSTSAMGTADILAANSGALVAEDSIEDFTEKVLRVLQDRQFRTRLSEEAKDYVKQWSAQASAEQMLTLYEATIVGYRRTNRTVFSEC